MHVHRALPVVTVYAPAKLNLFLEVLAKRRDGFHEIETLMVPIGLCDTLSFAAVESAEITCTVRWDLPRDGSGAARSIPLGDDNLAVRAARRLRETAGVQSGAAMHLVKRIPAAAGLAGGSSDAAAALSAANVAWQLHWAPARLASIAAEIGSDVPFFLDRKPALCLGRGEQVLPQAQLAPLHFVIVHPPTGLSTAEVYAGCRPAEVPRRAGALIESWRRGRQSDIGRLLHNRLQSAAAAISPWIDRLRREFDKLDVLGHQMTGSGSAYFGICRHARHARRLAATLRNRGFSQVFAVAGLT